MTDTAHHLLLDGTQAIRLDAGNPVSLAGGDSAWYVGEGRVDVFLVQGDDPDRVERIRCFSAEKGHILFSHPRDACGSLLGVGIPGTVVHRIDHEALLAPEHRPALAALLDASVAAIVEAIARGVDDTPPLQIPLTPGDTVRVEKLAVARPLEQTLWIRHAQGSSLYMGMEDLDPGSGWVPMTTQAWIQAVTDAHVDAADTATLLADGDGFRTHLRHFLLLALRCFSLGAAFASADRLVALREKAAADVRVTRGGLLRLASIMDSSMDAPGACDAGDALAAACAMVAQRIGVDVSALDAPLAGATVEEVAESGHMRARRVLLRGRWFREDGGPLVGFLSGDKRPVALLPASPRTYDVHDPADGSVRRVTADMAEDFDPAAYTLYRPLPDGKLGLADIPFFGLFGSWPDLARVVALAAVLGLTGLITPMLTRTIFNDIIPGAERGRLLQVVMILLGFTAASLLFEVAKSIAMVRVKARTDHNLETAIWERLLRLPANFFRRFTAGDLAQRAMALNSVQQLLSGASLSSMLSAFFSMIYLGQLFYFDAKLALVALGIVLASALATALVSVVQIRFQRRAVGLAGKISGLTLQFITGAAKLRAGGAEDRALMLWAEDFAEQRRVGYRLASVGNAFSAFNTLFATAGSMLIYIGVIYFERDTPMDIGTFMAFWAAFGGLQGGILGLVGAATSVLQAVPYFERMRPILDETPENSEAKGDPGDIRGNIELCNVSFRYDENGPLVLRDVSFSIRPGEFVAVTGPSGSGKTTLLRLLLGFETPQSGSILIENQDMAQLDTARIRKRMGVVLQNGGLLPGDIFTNIIGASTLTLDDAWRAAEMAGFAQDIRSMPMGMHTVISEGASTLSGGQKQRLIIARALARNPGVLLFDEATSALDNRTQETVTSSLGQLPVTRVVIAHRLSTIRDADRIIVLENGAVSETGTYDELMRARGTFHRLASRQIS